MKPRTQVVLSLFSVAGILAGILLLETSGGVRDRIVYLPILMVALLNLVALVVGARGGQ
ncbi:MAG: hypothetical protein IT577_05575 [Verrucomicrobiae bacterium]|nr:hypothetical protein [Verrucomicrobiae bacterium]